MWEFVWPVSRPSPFASYHECFFARKKVSGLRKYETLSNAGRREVWNGSSADNEVVPDPQQTSTQIVLNFPRAKKCASFSANNLSKQECN